MAGRCSDGPSSCGASPSPEFVFEYPSPPFTGRWEGAEAQDKRDRCQDRFENARLVTTGEDLRLYDSDWVVVCNQGEGILQGRGYKGLLTTVMHRIDGDGRVVEYRGFLGGLTTGPTAD